MRGMLLYNCDSYTRSRIAEIKFGRIIATVAYAGVTIIGDGGYIIIPGYCRHSLAFLPIF
jgi:hypothetical protein